MAEIVRVDPVHPETAVIRRAAQCLRDGGLVAFPTETVYGLGADATNAAAVRRIFAAKGRPASDPLIVHVPDLISVRPLVAHLPDAAVRLAEHLWPGPLTLVLSRSSLIGNDVTAGLDSVAVRVPVHPVARALLIEARIPVAAPSANLFSRPSPTLARHVFDDLGPHVDLILDSGPATVGLESTVLDLTVNPPRVLRPGGVSLERLKQILPNVIVQASQLSGTEAMPAPGMLTRHYSPRTPLTLFTGSDSRMVDRMAERVASATREGRRVAVLGHREILDLAAPVIGAASPHGETVFVDLGSAARPEQMAARLYATLRDCDAAGADYIFAFQVADDHGIGLAIRDRLQRASAGQIVNC